MIDDCPSLEDMLGPSPEHTRKRIGELHTTGRMPLATGWNTNLLAFIDAANFPGYVKTETLKCGAARVWFDSKGNLDAYVRSFSAAPNYNIRAAAD